MSDEERLEAKIDAFHELLNELDVDDVITESEILDMLWRPKKSFC